MARRTRSRGAAPDRLRILYLSWRDRENPESGGAETFMERTSEVLTQQGHEVCILTAGFPGGARSTHHGEVEVRRRGGKFTCYLHGLWHVLRHGHEYDVILDVQNGVPFWSPLVARVPVITIVHHVHEDQWAAVFGPAIAKVGWFLESRVAPFVHRTTRYVTVSKSSRDELAAIGVDADRVDLVYSGNDRPVDLDRYAALSRTSEPTLLFLGRLVPHKHVEQAVDIVAELAESHPTISLHVVGGGYWEDEIAAHADARGVRDRVHLHGFVPEEEKHRLLATSWVVVMPSHKEGWGLTIVEAGLHGTPAVAYSFAGGPSESIVHGRTGLLADSRAELSTHVRTLVDDARLRRQLGSAARIYAASFDWGRAGLRLEQIIGSVLGTRHRYRDDIIDLDALLAPSASRPAPEPEPETAATVMV